MLKESSVQTGGSKKSKQDTEKKPGILKNKHHKIPEVENSEYPVRLNLEKVSDFKPKTSTGKIKNAHSGEKIEFVQVTGEKPGLLEKAKDEIAEVQKSEHLRRFFCSS